MHKTQIVNREMMSRLCRQADNSERLRYNSNLHPHLSDPVQRFCNALQPGSYVQPHRHISLNKENSNKENSGRWELFVILQGEVAILLFDDNGRLLQRVILSAKGDNRLIEIAAGQWHCLYALQPDSVLFETKPGPYDKATDKDFAGWAPQEGESSVLLFMRWFEQAQVGDLPPDTD